MDKVMERLSTGKRVNSGADDPAGLMMAARLKSNALTNTQSARNANDAISLLQLYEGAGQVVIDILQKMREFAIQAGGDPYTLSDRISLDHSFNTLGQEWARLATETSWNNGVATMDTFNNSFGIRLDQSSTLMTMTLKSWDPTNRIAGQNITGATAIRADDENNRTDWAWGFNRVLNDLSTPPRANSKSHSHIQSRAAAANAVAKLDATIAGAVTELAQYGSYMKRLQFASYYSRDMATETNKAMSKIVDANYAKETIELARTQIISQAATAILAQANNTPQMILKLLD